MWNDIILSGFADEIAAQLSRVKPVYHPQIKKIHTAVIELLTMQEPD